jgi:hypothetical protein
VVTKEDGTTPLQGVSVQAVYPVNDSIAATAVTGADGAYYLSSLSAGTYHLQAVADGYFPSFRSSYTVTSGQTVQVNFALQESGEAYHDDFSATTGWSGDATSLTSNGNVMKYRTVMGSGYYQNVSKSLPQTYDKAVYPYVTIRNRVALNSGKIQTVDMTFDPYDGWNRRLVFASANQSVPWQDVTYLIPASGTPYNLNALMMINDADDGVGSMDVDHYLDYLLIHSADRGYVGGQVKTPSGAPLADTRVQLRKGAVVIGEALTDASGNYAIWAATAAAVYTVYASSSNGSQFTLSGLPVSGRTQTMVNVTLEPWPPAAVTGARFTATAKDSAMVAWDAYGSDGYWIAFSTDPSFEVWQSSQAIPGGTPSAAFYSLEPNTTYYFKVKGQLFGDGYYSAVVSSATPPVPPAAFSFTSVDIDSAALQWTGGGNPPGTVYQAEAAIDEGFSTAAGLSSGTAVTAVFGYLNPNTTYYFNLRTLGFGGQDAAFASVLSAITLTHPPASETYALVSSTGLSVFWDGNGNPDWTRYEITESTSETFATVNYSSVTDSNYFEASGLTPNTTYYYRAAAVNGSGLRSAVTGFAPAVTYAAAPLANPPSLGVVTGTSVETRWLINDNPVYTEYYVQASTDALFRGIDYGPGSWFAAPAYNVISLESGRPYYFRVKARDFLGRSSAWLDLGTRTTLVGADNTPPSVVDLQGGDDAWRGAASGAYRVHFSDLGSGLDRLEVKITSGPAAGGVTVYDWTDAVTGMNTTEYAEDWVLPEAAFEAIQENVTSYVSLRIHDRTGNNFTYYPDAFYVRRDTTPPTITDLADSPAGWLAADPGAVFNVDFADALSGLTAVYYSASNQPSMADANVLGWTAIDVFTSSPSYTAAWGVNFGALQDGASNYISVKAVDAAGNATALQDVFRILKNTIGPAVGITAPHAGYVSTAATLSGTSASMTEYSPVVANEVAVQELTGGLYYDGTAFASVPQVWLAAQGLSSWAYNASTVPFAAGTQYKVYARARDVNSFLTPLPYPNVTFQLDQQAPTVFVSTPTQGLNVYAFDAVEGTAADTGGAGLVGAEVYLMRLADGKWWNFQTSAWGDVPVSSAPPAGSPWVFSPDNALRSALAHGQQYYAGAAARDAASPANVSPFGSAGSTFTWVDATAPEAVTSFAPSTGTSPGRVNLAWTFPGDDGGAFALTYGRYAVQYSTWAGAAFSTQAAQVMISTGLVPAGAPQRYTVAGLNPETTYYFTLWTEDDAGLWSGPSPLASTLSGESLDDMISGSVKTPAGAGVTGVMVEAITNTGLVAASGYTLDDGLGSFTLTGLADGLYRVQATWLEEGFASSVAKDRIPMGYADANFVLSVSYALASVTGSLPSSSPARVQGAAVRAAGGGEAQLWQGTRMVASAAAGPGGRFAIRNLLPGRYELRVSGGDGAWRSFPIKLSGGQNLEITPLGALLKPGSAYAYPNPARSYIIFRLQTEIFPVKANLAVYSLDGRLVRSSEYGTDPGWTRTAGTPDTYEYRWDFTGGKPASGVYFYTLRLKHELGGGNDGERGKFAVIR